MKMWITKYKKGKLVDWIATQEGKEVKIDRVKIDPFRKRIYIFKLVLNPKNKRLEPKLVEWIDMEEFGARTIDIDSDGYIFVHGKDKMLVVRW